MTEFNVVFEKAGDGSWSAHASGLPVFSCGDTLDEAKAGIAEAIELYLDKVAEDGDPTPDPEIVIDRVSV